MSVFGNVIPLFINGIPSLQQREANAARKAVRQQIPVVGLKRELLSTFVKALNECYSLDDLDEAKAIFADANASNDPVVLQKAIRRLNENAMSQILLSNN